jgi:hypothetical protein
MISVTTSPPHISMFRKYNTWYTTKDGNWSDPTVWESNGSKRHSYPQAGDTVYVNHVIDYTNTYNGIAYLFNNLLKDLYISGKLTCNGIGLNQCRLIVTGNLQCTGTIDFSTATSGVTLELRGDYTRIANFNTGTTSTIQYNSLLTQTVCSVAYYNLQISNTNTKILSNDLTVNGVLTIDGGSILELGAYNSTIAGCLLQGLLQKSSSTGAVNFTGAINYKDGTGCVNFTGNPTINLSGNIGLNTSDMRGGSNFGGGTLNVLTNQSWTPNTVGNLPVSFGNVSIVIASGKTLTINSQSGNNGGLLINGTSSINGTDGTSILNINGAFAYGNTSVPMSTGVFNYNNSGTSQIYIYTGVTMTVPFATFYALTVYGTATLSANTTVGSTLYIPSGSLQLAAYNLSVSGLTNYAGSLLKSGNGTVNFNVLTPQNGTGAISFTSNPAVNLSGNIIGDCRAGFNLGSGLVTVSANLSLGLNIGGSTPAPISFNINIASGVTLRNTGYNGSSATLGGLIMTGVIAGADATAIFDNRSLFIYNNAASPMAIGKLFCNQAAN